MSKLLYAGVHRYGKSIFFWISVLLTAVLGVGSGYWARYRHNIDVVCVFAELAIMALLLIWMVGREYEEGIFRNKFVAGYTKGTVYLSELVLGLGAGLVLFFLYTLIFGAFNGYLLKVLPISVSVRIFLCFLFINMGIAAAFVTISCRIPHRAITVIVSVVLVAGIAITGDYVHTELDQQEYLIIIPDGVVQHSSSGVAELTSNLEAYQVPNEYYLGGWIRPVAEVFDELNIFQSISEELASLQRYTGFASYRNDNGFTYWDSPDSQFEYDVGHNEMYTENLCYAPVLLLMSSILGYCLFRKKEFK